MPRMTKSLAIALTVTDSLFLAYWLVAALSQAGVLHVPREWMYAGYDEPRVVAWNWSFLPIDLAFSLSGLYAVAASRRGSRTWAPVALLSLAFTFAAGGMAIGYWTLLCEFRPSWFLPNLLLVIWPLFFVRRLIAISTTPSENAVVREPG